MNHEAENLHNRRMALDAQYRRRFRLYAQQASSKFRIRLNMLETLDCPTEVARWIILRAYKEEYAAWREWQAQGVPVERSFGVKPAPNTHGVSRVEYLQNNTRKHAKRPYRNISLVEASDSVAQREEWTLEQAAAFHGAILSNVLADKKAERMALWLSLTPDERMMLTARRMAQREVSATHTETVVAEHTAKYRKFRTETRLVQGKAEQWGLHEWREETTRVPYMPKSAPPVPLAPVVTDAQVKQFARTHRGLVASVCYETHKKIMVEAGRIAVQ